MTVHFRKNISVFLDKECCFVTILNSLWGQEDNLFDSDHETEYKMQK